MGDFKSKLPDLKELGEITSKLLKDFKTSINEIVAAYKEKHAESETAKAEKAEEEHVEITEVEKIKKSTKTKTDKKDDSEGS